MEIAFVSSNKVRAEIEMARGGIINRILNIYYSNREMLISTLLIGNNIANIVYSMAMAKLLTIPLQAYISNPALLLLTQTVIATLIILIFGEFVPKTIFRINPNASLRTASIPLYMIYCVLYPISRFTEWLSALLMKLFGIKINSTRVRLLTVDELDAYLQENIDKREDENKTVEREVKIFENALDFSDTRLRDCMVPRNEIVAVDVEDTTRDDLVKLFTQSGLSKIVVYKESIDDVIGFIQVSELFVTTVDWKTRLKPVLFAPETLLARKMMQQLMDEKRSNSRGAWRLRKSTSASTSISPRATITKPLPATCLTRTKPSPMWAKCLTCLPTASPSSVKPLPVSNLSGLTSLTRKTRNSHH